MDATSCVIELKGNITFHEKLRVYQNDNEFWEFDNCRVIVQETQLLITMQSDGDLKDYSIKYDKVWMLDASPKIIKPISFDNKCGWNRFKYVHSLPSDNHYVTDTFQDYFEDSFKIFSVVEGEESAKDIVRFLNNQEEKVNMYNALLLLEKTS